MVIGKIADATGKIENDTGKIIEVTGKINQDTGKMHFSEDFSGETSETVDESETSRYRGQRGPDKKPRDFPLHTLKNLPQFRDKPHEEVRRYIKETKGVDIGGNVNWDRMILWLLIGLAIVAGGIGIWKLYEKYQMHQKADEEITDAEYTH